jgi:lipopolysaccharide export system permease protein
MNKTAERIWDYKIRQHEVPILWNQENVWYWGKNAIYHIRLYDQRERALQDASLFYLDQEFNLKQRIDAKQIVRRNGQWVAKQGVVIDLTRAGINQQWFDEKILQLPETPEDFKSFEAVPEDLSWLTLYNYTSKLSREGCAAAPYEVELHRRIAFPVTTFILALLGINMALRQGLHGGIATGALLALLLAFVYLTLSQLGCSLATSGMLAPIIGVWAVNIIFTALAGYLWVANDR